MILISKGKVPLSKKRALLDTGTLYFASGVSRESWDYGYMPRPVPRGLGEL